MIQSLEILKKLFVIILIIFSSNQVFSSNFYGYASIDNIYDDNIFGTNDAQGSFLNSFGGTIGFSPQESDFALNYRGNYILFHNLNNKSYYVHNLSAIYDILFSNQSISLATAISARHNQTDNNYYDYSQILSSIVYNVDFENFGNLFFGYKARYKYFDNITDMSFLEHFLAFGYSVSFPTKTRLSLDFDFGHKNYLKLKIIDSTTQRVPPPVPPIPNPRLENERRRGLNLRNQRNPNTISPGIFIEQPKVNMLGLGSSISQSLGKNTGIRFSLEKQWLLNENGTAFIRGTLDRYAETELFDDPYSYSKEGISATLTNISFGDIILELDFYYIEKQYIYPSDIDNPTLRTPNRNDFLSGTIFTASKMLDFDDSFFKTLEFKLSYDYTNNLSNSKYFRYFSNAIHFSVKTGF